MTTSTAPPSNLRRIFAVSLGATLVAMMVLAGALLIGAGPAAEAATCSLTTTVPNTNWTDTTKWSGCLGSFPGAAAGDTAVVGLSGFSLNVDAIIPNGVNLQITSSNVAVNIPSGSALQLESASSSTSATNGINVNGGQLGIGSGTVTWGGSLILNTGALTLNGTLNHSTASTYAVNGGTINGSGSLTVGSGTSLSFTGSGGGMTIDGATIDNLGIISYPSSTGQSLSLVNGAQVNVQNGAQFNITGNDPIQTNNVASPAIDIFSGGSMAKSVGTTTQIDAIVNNGGSVTVSTGRLNLYGGGTHSGAFSTATGGTTMAFTGSHGLAAGTTAVGAGVFELAGGNFNVNTTAGAPWAPQFFTQSGGALDGTGTIRVTNTFNWTAGTQSSAGTTEVTNITNVTGGSVTLDTGRIVTNTGLINYAPTTGVLTIDGGARIENSGTIDLQNDAPIASSSPAISYINNSGAGLFRKTAGTTSSINCGFNLTGTATLQPGAGTTIALFGGTAAAGSFGGSPSVLDLTGAGSKVDLAGGNFSFAGSGVTVSGTGTLRLSGSAGLLLTSGPMSVTNFVQDGTSLLKTNVQGIVVPAGGTYAWNGGTVDGFSAGSDVITVNAAGATLNLTGSSGAMTMQNSAHIRNAGGTINFNPLANLLVNSGSVIDNAAGVFAFNNNNSFGIATDSLNNPRFLNNGTVTKAANPNSVQVAVKFDHNTTLTVNGGALRLTGGGTSAGSMTATNAADRIEIGAGNYFMAAGATVGGAGVFAVAPGAVLTNNTSLNVTNFELDGGTVNGGGGLTINNGFKWLGGTFTGAGSATTAAGVVTDATALTGGITLADGFTFNNNGPFNYNPTFNLNFQNSGPGGATFNNNSLGVFDIMGNGITAVAGIGNSFGNLGTIKKTAGAGGFTFTVRTLNQGSGIIDEQFGSNSTLAFNALGSGMTGGTVQASDAAGVVEFNGGDFTATGGTFTGAGKIRVNGGLLQVNANINATTTLQVDSGTLDVSSPNTFQITTLHWNGGTIQGAGSKRVFGGYISAASPTTLGGSGFLTIPGTFSYDADAVSYLTIPATAKLNVESGGTMTITSNGIIAGAATARLSSSGGTLTKSGLSTARINVPLDFTVGSGGTINITGGILEVAGGGTIAGSAGSVAIGAGARLDAVAGILNINPSASLSGAGTLRLSGGTVNLNTVTTVTNLLLDAGTLAGTANVTLDGGTWTGGDMNGTGTTSVNSGRSFEIATGTAKTLRRNLVNNGTLFTQAVPASLTLENGVLLTNNSFFELQQNTNIFCTCSPTPSRLLNALGGTMTQFAAATTSSIAAVFDNDGLAMVQTGTLGLLNGGTHTGDFTVSVGATLFFLGASDSFASTTSITGGGTVGFGATTSSFAGDHSLTGSGLTIVQGGVSFTSASTISTPALEIRSGSIGGTSNIAINGGGASTSSWKGGTIGGTGTLTLAAGATMNWDATSGAITLDGRTFTNNGTITYTSAVNPLTLANTASIANAGTFNIQSDTAINAGPGTNTFSNSGTFAKTLGAATTNLAPAFDNFNLVDLASGTVSFDGGFTQHVGTTTLNGGGLASPITININSGVFGGIGTVTGNVSSAGNLNPGLSPGGLTISGNYNQSSAGVLNIELGGATPVTQYDRLTVTGAATLDGTINVTLFGGFVPADGNTFDPLTFASSTGTFSTENLPTFAGGGSFTSSYQPTVYRLAALTTQADVSATQTTSGPALHGQNATFTVTVTNAGADPATGVVLSDTMSGATLVSAASTIGSCTPGSPIVCTIGTLGIGQSATVTITVNADTIGSITNSGSVAANEFDPNTGNNATGTATIIVAAAANLSVAITDSPDPVGGGGPASYTVSITNAGPDNAASATVNLTMTNGSMTSASSAAFTCSGSATSKTCTALSPLAASTTATITVNVTAPAASGTMSLTASASSATADPVGANNTATEITTVSETTDLSISKSGPSTVSAGGSVSYTIVVTNNGTANATNVVINDPTPPHFLFASATTPCASGFPCSLGTLAAGQSKTVTASYNVSSNRANEGRTITNTASVTSNAVDSIPSNNQGSAQTTIDCENGTPIGLSPAGGATVPADGTLTWQGNGQNYVLYLGPAGTGCSTQFGTTSAQSLSYSGLTPGSTYEWRVVSERGVCARKTSACVTFKVETTCTRPETPLARVVGQQTSSKTYSVEWDAVPDATRYEVDEASNAEFSGATTSVVQGLAKDFKHDVITSTAFYYRVRAFNDCGTERGADSPTIRVVIIPLVTNEKPGPNVNIPAGSQELVVQQVFIPGEENQSLFFTATTDRPWLTVHPASGPLPPQGVTVAVTADPRTLPNGTFTASLIVTITSSAASSPSTHGGTTVAIPVSINLVTPVSPVASKDATSQYAMVIPSIGHLDGINSFWQSDVRITNAGFRSYRYRLTFTPSGGTASGVKQTTITVDAGATTALDDIVRNWYGLGALGDNGGGMLEILPIDDPAVASAATVASSRTYNVTDNGTLGQFIPAVRFNNFIGQALNGGLASVLSLQQIAESSAYRTNVGVLEASGSPASVLLNVFSSAGAKLLTVPMQLAAGEQRQLNSFLAQNNITLADGRVEVQVAGGTGKVTAYASVIDNQTRDPLLVSGTLLAAADASKWVLPGVANIDNPVAHWRTDMRVFNYGSSVQPATLTFHPGGNGAPKSVDVLLDPGAVLTLDDVLRTKFGLVNTGGVVHVTTPGFSSLVVTARTYNQTSTGTLGQFIPAVTPQEAVGTAGPTLHILQVEDSPRYRTNIGLAEVTGAPALVELQVILPDSKFTPTVQVPLAANEFRQFALLRDLALGNVYNARVTARVISGNGRVTAYGSVIDEQTQDPTYVPAQK